MRKSMVLATVFCGVFSHCANAQIFFPITGTTEGCLDDGASIFNQVTEGIDINTDRPTVVVGYHGDPGTFERLNAISFPQTWAIDQFVGVSNASLKLGLYDQPLPVGSSGIAVNCQEAGFLVNTFQFDHTQPVRGGGPQGSLGIKKFFPRPVYGSSISQMVIQGYVKHPYHHWTEPGAVGQIVLAYYMQPLVCYDKRSGAPYPCPAATAQNNVPAFAHVIALYDSRNNIGTYNEFFGNDTFTGFFSSPLANFQENGAPPQYLKKSIYSAPMAEGNQTWTNYNFFRAEISYEKMANMISIFRGSAPSVAAITSPNPVDWGIVLVGGLVETLPAPRPECVRGINAPMCLNIAMATTFGYIQAFRVDGALGVDGVLGSDFIGPAPLGVPPVSRSSSLVPMLNSQNEMLPVITGGNYRSLLGG